ncbi:hypothetical protein DICPUDRAFT_28207 [Dictyostelium purpureum]|uniref:Protein arginine N-methyltransferase n=1 Tax=Dictyostelium purpureum TaxID=5786 RepID=F0ZBJ5_DICPU|nr:uncharacterized protein DICPUDRAFT_28207 [Dictyostelium purpureum]EGC38677.1 hypothetical protein DICPUDRAFT_28207 [Dictyostelium purpureum]|eukprot:XP_003284773.1 hypothetical protein DICPUDRAFT_28207 [Dictyostelium purpureum]
MEVTKINTAQYEFSCGVELETVVNILNDIERAYQLDYHFLILPISHPRFNRDFTALSLGNSFSNKAPFTRSDVLLPSNYWKSVVVGKVSESVVDCDSSDYHIRVNSIKTLKQEISWAAHLSLPAILLPSPNYSSIHYAQAVNQSLSSLHNMRVWIRIPLLSPKSQLLNKEEYIKGEELDKVDNTWEWWNNFRSLCGNSLNLFPALELTSDLPDKEQLQQWCGEQIKCVIIPTSIFLTNSAGYPTLSRAHQAFLKKLFNLNIQYVVTGNEMEQLEDYKTYVKFLHGNQKPMTEDEYFEMPYLDFLQAPLQPLMDNLESQTYEVFEKDPIKYREYQNAVREALLDLDDKDYTEDNPIVIMVVGAGRGPLVKCSINASIEAKKKVKVFAVEKNPNAIVTLRNRVILEGWEDLVTIIDSDMREWDTEYRADIMVSELLGSFGDNELSPECLDGAQKYLKKDKGISIPCWYTSYIAPISSSKLYNEVSTFGELKHYETPYVVKPHNYHQLAESKPLFTFKHPNYDKVIDNSRTEILEFQTTVKSTVCHGFIGYFDCCLYKNVHISINPKNFSTGMFSWFPIYFPLKEPVYIPQNSTIKCSFWRTNNKTKVWYEWCLLSPQITPIQNVNGRSYYIGL